MELRKVIKHPSVTDYAQHHGHLLNDNKGFVVFLNVWEALDPGLWYPVSTFHQTGHQRHCDAPICGSCGVSPPLKHVQHPKP